MSHLRKIVLNALIQTLILTLVYSWCSGFHVSYAECFQYGVSLFVIFSITDYIHDHVNWNAHRKQMINLGIFGGALGVAIFALTWNAGWYGDFKKDHAFFLLGLTLIPAICAYICIYAGALAFLITDCSKKHEIN